MMLFVIEAELKHRSLLQIRIGRLKTTVNVSSIVKAEKPPTVSLTVKSSLSLSQFNRWLEENPIIKAKVDSLVAFPIPNGEHPCTRNENAQHLKKPE